VYEWCELNLVDRVMDSEVAVGNRYLGESLPYISWLAMPFAPLSGKVAKLERPSVSLEKRF
jgi:hypothetical protein